MQLYSPFFTVIALSLFLFLQNREAPTTHTITLRVNTATVEELNIDQTCNFGQAVGISNRDYTTIVKRGDIVVWNGVSSTSPESDVVQVESIIRDTGKKVFTRDTLASTGQNPGVVLGTVASGQDGDVLKYSITFKVLNEGRQRGGIYRVDPKLMIKD